MSQNKSELGTGNIRKLIIGFAIPSIVAMIVTSLYNIVDQVFIGRSIGELGNAATTVAFPLSTCCTALSLLMGVGGSSIFNIHVGKGEKEKATYFYGNAVAMLVIFGTILSAITLLFLEPLLVFFGAPANDTLMYAKQYTSVTAIGFPALLLSVGGGHLIRADGSPKYAMTCNIVGAVINVALDALFVFGFEWGMYGAALATIIGQTIASLMVVKYLLNCKSITLKKEHLRVRFKYVSKIIKIGMGPFCNQLAMLVVQVVLNSSLKKYGAASSYGDTIPLAVVGVVSKVNMIYLSVMIGLSQGMQPIASYNYGAKNYDRVKKAYGYAIKFGIIGSIIAFSMFQIFPEKIIGIFGSGSKEYVEFAVKYFRIYLFFTFINCIQGHTSTFYTAIGKPIKGIFISLTRQVLFLLPLIVILPKFMGIDGVVYAGPIADFAAVIVAIIMIRRTFKKELSTNHIPQTQ